MKRKLHLIVQAQGGSGKSLYTYLRALSQRNGTSLFVDADAYFRTSSSQLAFLGEARLSSLARWEGVGGWLPYLDSQVARPFSEIFVDFGSAESSQLPVEIAKGWDVEAWGQAHKIEPVFHLIISGGGIYLPCVRYFQELRRALGPLGRVQAWANAWSFRHFPRLVQELTRNCERQGLSLYSFGNFEPHTLLGRQILQGVRQGIALEEYPPGARLRLRKELQDCFYHVYRF